MHEEMHEEMHQEVHEEVNDEVNEEVGKKGPYDSSAFDARDGCEHWAETVKECE